MTQALHWLSDFSEKAALTDRFKDSADHVELLAAGMMGEAGGVLAEIKKKHRESQAYPAYRGRLVEELGDLLWYYVRLVTTLSPTLLQELVTTHGAERSGAITATLDPFLDLGAAAGRALELVRHRGDQARLEELRTTLANLWSSIQRAAESNQVDLSDAATRNLNKTASRWPTEKAYAPLFDDAFPEEEQLPRKLEVEFRDRSRDQQGVVILRCNNLNFGDRLTDNIQDADGYRYHDIFTSLMQHISVGHRSFGRFSAPNERVFQESMKEKTALARSSSKKQSPRSCLAGPKS